MRRNQCSRQQEDAIAMQQRTVCVCALKLLTQTLIHCHKLGQHKCGFGVGPSVGGGYLILEMPAGYIHEVFFLIFKYQLGPGVNFFFTSKEPSDWGLGNFHFKLL